MFRSRFLPSRAAPVLGFPALAAPPSRRLCRGGPRSRTTGCLGIVNDEANVATRPHRSKILIFSLVEFVTAHAQTRWVHLQVKKPSSSRTFALHLVGERGSQ